MTADETKKCTKCGVNYDLPAWKTLELVGHQHCPADEFGPEETVEMRNCPCGTTLGVLLETSEMYAVQPLPTPGGFSLIHLPPGKPE